MHANIPDGGLGIRITSADDSNHFAVLGYTSRLFSRQNKSRRTIDRKNMSSREDSHDEQRDIETEDAAVSETPEETVSEPSTENVTQGDATENGPDASDDPSVSEENPGADESPASDPEDNEDNREEEGEEDSSNTLALTDADSHLDTTTRRRVFIPTVLGVGAVGLAAAAFLSKSDAETLGFLTSRELFSLASAAVAAMSLVVFFSSSVKVTHEPDDTQPLTDTETDLPNPDIETDLLDGQGSEESTDHGNPDEDLTAEEFAAAYAEGEPVEIITPETEANGYTAALTEARSELRAENLKRRDAEERLEATRNELAEALAGNHPEVEKLIAAREQTLSETHAQNLRDEKNETERVVGMYETQLDQLRNDRDGLADRVIELEQTAEASNTAHVAEVAELGAAASAAAQAHSAAVDELNQAHATAVAETEAAHTETVNGLLSELETAKEDHQETVKRLNESHDQALVESANKYSELENQKRLVDGELQDLTANFDAKVTEAQNEERERLIITLETITASAVEETEDETIRSALADHGDRLASAVRRLHGRSSSLGIPSISAAAPSLPQVAPKPEPEPEPAEEAAPETPTAEQSKRSRGFRRRR